MREKALHIVDRMLFKWRALQILEIVLCSLIVFATAFFLELDGLSSVVVTLITFMLLFFWRKPGKNDHEALAVLINQQLPSVQYSTHQIFTDDSHLTTLGKLQQYRAAQALVNDSAKIKLPFRWNRVIRIFLFCSFGVLLHPAVSRFFSEADLPAADYETEDSGILLDESSAVPDVHPRVVEFSITATPPTYTAELPVLQAAPELEVIEGSRVKWKIIVNTPVDSLFLVTSTAKKYPVERIDSLIYQASATIKGNGFYKFLLTKDGESHSTDLFPVEVILDQPPALQIKGIDQREEFDYGQEKKVSFDCLITDDFGLTASYIIATVSKGSGESVKFREQKLLFNEKIQAGDRSVQLSKTIDLSALAVTPGDELYFYVEAVDNRPPNNQRNRTATYFLTVLDTTKIEFSIAGDLGVDVMPEYFRSQRQIIIDTKKLIARKGELQESDFNFTSNELGFDQKSLRIKYGQFMGEEFETSTSSTVRESPDEDTSNRNLLKEFFHKHDSENEHNIVDSHDHDHNHHHDHDHNHDHGHGHEQDLGQEEEENPLEEYQHIHDDPEEATFFTVSVKEKLRRALREMWDSELYLRLYKPEKSLTYQYRALKLLKEIKNQARVYVHRIGFDPAPIKEDARLTGDVDEVKNTSRILEVEATEVQTIHAASQILQKMVENGDTFTGAERVKLKSAGTTLGLWAVENPGKYLETLSLLNQCIALNGRDQTVTLSLLQRFLKLIDPEPKNSSAMSYPQDALSQIFRENLDQFRD
ncbi:MAG: hypothetical protein AAF519_14615 [Bacteroidota bacterium]